MPSETSVSIVAAPCRRLVQAALWNGHAAHSTTGVTRFSESHWKLSNCRAGTIASTSAGSDSTAASSTRRRRAAMASGSRSARSSPAAGVDDGRVAA